MFTPFATTSISERRAEVGDPAEVALPSEQKERERQPDHRDLEVLDGVLRRLPVDADQPDERLCGEPEGDGDGGPEREREPERLRAEAVRRLPRACADRAGHLRGRAVREEVEHREGAAQQEPGGAERRELRGAEVADDRRVDEDEGRLCGERPEREDGEAKDLAVVRRAPQCGDHSIAERYAAQVVRDHPLGREALFGESAAHERVQPVGLLDRVHHLAVVVDDDPGAAVVDHLGDGAVTGGDHRRAARHRLDHHEAERLLPLDREERRPRVLEQLDLLRRG